MKLYRLLLRLYPPGFRADYSEPMQQLVRDQSRRLPPLQLYATILADLFRSLPQAHLDEIRNQGMKHLLTPFTYLFSLAAMAFLARVELHSDDSGVIVGLVLAMTFTLGCLHPKRAWLWALTALCIPAAELLWGAASNYDMMLLAGFMTFIGLCGSFAGAYARVHLAQ